MKFTTLLTSIIAIGGITVGGITTASADGTLDIVKKRGHLRCQVGTPSAGFYNLDSKGKWYGLDVATCQAVAAAIFGDKEKIHFSL